MPGVSVPGVIGNGNSSGSAADQRACRGVNWPGVSLPDLGTGISDDDDDGCLRSGVSLPDACGGNDELRLRGDGDGGTDVLVSDACSGCVVGTSIDGTCGNDSDVSAVGPSSGMGVAAWGWLARAARVPNRKVVYVSLC
ncbi:hypothetical protein, partial [Catellatospora citrea]|uniref:hypothetical protein n=1 Tax=Catellatospora citrea TaxID=53366 RepID=UPI0019405F79